MMKLQKLLQIEILAALCLVTLGEFPRHGDGSDGPLDLSLDTLPNGVTKTGSSCTIQGGDYQFTYVFIPPGITCSVTGSNPLRVDVQDYVDIKGTLNADGGSGSLPQAGGSGVGVAGGGNGGLGEHPGSGFGRWGKAGFNAADRCFGGRKNDRDHTGGTNGGGGGGNGGSGGVGSIGYCNDCRLPGWGGGYAEPNSEGSVAENINDAHVSGRCNAGVSGSGGSLGGAGSGGGGASWCSKNNVGGRGGEARPYEEGDFGATLLAGGCGGGGGSSGGTTGGGGGAGGGAIQFRVSGEFLVDGLISANGGQGGQADGNNNNGAGGGGSGGTIYIIARSLAVSGTIQARGGDGGTSTARVGDGGRDGAGGGGGAGRLLLYAQSFDLNGILEPQASILGPYVEGSVPPKNGGGMGDPHFKRWDGSYYDFHGSPCDLVLVEAKSLDLTIHLRTQPRHQYSYIESAAICIEEDVLEIGSYGTYFLNGVEGARLPQRMANKYTVIHDQENKKKHHFLITLDEATGESIVVKTFKDMVSVTVENASELHFGSSKGLMGKYSDGSLLGRDGSVSFRDDDVDSFGQEWQVLATEPLLFQSPSLTIGSPCIPPSPQALSSWRRFLVEGTIPESSAEKACANHQGEKKKMCILDVITMNDLEVAQAHMFW